MLFSHPLKRVPAWQTGPTMQTSVSWIYWPQKSVKQSFPPKSNRKNNRIYDKVLYKARHLIENFFQKLSQYRSIATRYDKTSTNFLGAIHLVASVVYPNTEGLRVLSSCCAPLRALYHRYKYAGLSLYLFCTPGIYPIPREAAVRPA